MKLSAIHASKVTAFVEVDDLNPQGKIFPPDMMDAIAARCEFRKSPENFGKEVQPTGAVFEIGRWGDQPISKLTLFRDGIVLETASSTEDTESTLQEMLVWAREEIGIRFEPEMIKRKVFYSNLVVYLNIQLDSLHSVLAEIAAAISGDTTKQINLPMVYRTAGITISPSTLIAKHPTGAFSIERRIDVPDSENKYFSGAPLRTSEHLALLEKFEKALQK